MEPDVWHRIDDIGYQQMSGGAKIPMSNEEKKEFVEIGKAMIDSNSFDSQRMQLSFNNDFTEVKKSTWVFTKEDRLNIKQKNKEKWISQSLKTGTGSYVERKFSAIDPKLPSLKSKKKELLKGSGRKLQR